MRSGDMDMQLIDKFPPDKITEPIFQNKGAMFLFEDISNEILDNRDTIQWFNLCNFDNDGDIDIVCK